MEAIISADNAQVYIEILDTYLIPFDSFGDEVIFQNDIAFG